MTRDVGDYHFQAFRSGEEPGGGGGRYHERLIETLEPPRKCDSCTLCVRRRATKTIREIEGIT